VQVKELWLGLNGNSLKGKIRERGREEGRTEGRKEGG